MEELGWVCCDVGEGGLEGWGRRCGVGVVGVGVAHCDDDILNVIIY